MSQLIFLPLIFVLYWTLADRFRWILLLMAGLVFYWNLNPRYFHVLPVVAAVAYAAGMYLQGPRQDFRRKFALGSAIAAILGLLTYFKYLREGEVVPLGISFFSLAAIGYLVDVYRKTIEAESHSGRFFLFLCFFPTLIAGPIERAGNLMTQFKERASVDRAQLRAALLLIGVGLVKKYVMGDTLFVAVEPVFSQPQEHFGLVIGVTAILARYQIFCDFSGYTDIARGVARLFGIRLMENFNRPFASASVAEYWQRWHISLSTWIRDYIFFPLISGPFARLGLHINLMITFLLLGIWHGNSVCFALYGLLQGVLISASDILRKKGQPSTQSRSAHRLKVITCFLFLICLPTLLFRASDLKSAASLYGNLFEWRTEGLGLFFSQTGGRIGVVIGLIVIMEWLQSVNAKAPIIGWFEKRSRIFRWTVYASIFACLLLYGQFGKEIDFTYRKF